MECLVRAVDGVKLSGDQVDRHIDDRKADRTAAQRLNDPFLDGRDIVARDRAADDAVGKSETGAAGHRLDFDRNIGELAVSAALALEAGMLLAAASDRLLIGDPGA